MEIAFVNQVPGTARMPRAAIADVGARADELLARARKHGSVSVVFVSNAASRRLNRRYRGKDKPTNVLSFASREEGELGDILIAPKLARRESRELELGFSEYAVILFVHGLLHLLGYGHSSPNSARRMERASEKILNTK